MYARDRERTAGERVATGAGGAAGDRKRVTGEWGAGIDDSNRRVSVGVGRSAPRDAGGGTAGRSEEHTSELQSHLNLVCRLLLEKKKEKRKHRNHTKHLCVLLFGHKEDNTPGQVKPWRRGQNENLKR